MANMSPNTSKMVESKKMESRLKEANCFSCSKGANAP